MKKLLKSWSFLERIKIAPASMLVMLAFSIVLNQAQIALAYTPPAPQNPQSTVVGLTGTIPSPPPAIGATISVPANGQSFNALPINVQGICQSNLLIKLFINNVFAGAAECTNSSYKITSALFNGANALVVRDYDSLDQQGPDSNVVNVSFNNPNVGAGQGVTLTSSYAKLGTSPGSTLSWPIVVSGGSPSYALSIVWGDGKPDSLVSQGFAGKLNITHIFETAGVYTILVKATDLQGNVAYLQLVGMATGPASQASGSTTLNTPAAVINKGIPINTTTIGTIAAIVVLVPLVTFWLGSRHRLINIKKKFENGEDL
jgi:hypothetical protein